MDTNLLAGCVMVAVAVAWTDWRKGFFFLILVGTLQDPVRKLAPGTPALLAIAALPVWLAIVVSAFRSDPSLWRRFQRAYPPVAKAMGVFVLCLIPPMLLVLSYGLGAWRMALLGSFAYLAPLVMVVVGFSLVRRPADLRSLLVFYAGYTALFLCGAWLEFLGFYPDNPALGTAALGVKWMRTRTGLSAITLITGFYRSPDLMAWHAATLVMAATTLAMQSRRMRDRLWLAAAVWGGACLLMAGRRKAMIMPVLFVASLALHSFTQGKVGRIASLAAVSALIVFSVLFAAGEVSLDSGYLEYAASAATEAPTRLSQGTAGALRETFIQSGLLGRGIGSATQGAQHLVDTGVERGWQESGASKVLAELGLPGFLCALWLGFVLSRGVLRAGQRKRARRDDPIVGALTGILVANAASFTISHQIYADIVVVTLTATLLGVTLSAPRWLPEGPSDPTGRGVARPLASRR